MNWEHGCLQNSYEPVRSRLPPHFLKMIKIEKLKESDVSAYHKLIRRVILNTPYYSKFAKKEESTGYPAEWLRKSIKNKRRLLLCAKNKNRVVGFAFGSNNAGMFHLTWIGVDSKYRESGIAERFVKKIESWAKNRVHKIWLDTRTNNKESMALFQKLKYKKAATFRKHYYGQDFYIWEKLI